MQANAQWSYTREIARTNPSNGIWRITSNHCPVRACAWLGITGEDKVC